jgi:hypothetical protein
MIKKQTWRGAKSKENGSELAALPALQVTKASEERRATPRSIRKEGELRYVPAPMTEAADKATPTNKQFAIESEKMHPARRTQYETQRK